MSGSHHTAEDHTAHTVVWVRGYSGHSHKTGTESKQPETNWMVKNIEIKSTKSDQI